MGSFLSTLSVHKNYLAFTNGACLSNAMFHKIKHMHSTRSFAFSNTTYTSQLQVTE